MNNTFLICFALGMLWSMPAQSEAIQPPNQPFLTGGDLLTPKSQVQFYTALIQAVRAVPEGLGIGVIVWEPDTSNWNSVFDRRGNALSAVLVLGN